MPFEEREMPHTVVMEGRQRLSVTGVEEVESFDESTVVTVTAISERVGQKGPLPVLSAFHR